MRNLTKFTLVAALCGVCFTAGHLMAQEGMPQPEWTKTTSEHKELMKGVGDWDAVLQFWMMPGAAPMEAKATVKQTSVLKGRYLKMEFDCPNMMGMSFKGIGYTGYDTVDKAYTSIWMDDMSPVMISSTGKPGEGKVDYKSRGVNFMMGTKQDERQELVWHGDDKFVMSFFIPGMDGKEFKQREIVYTRKKAGGEKSPETPK